MIKAKIFLKGMKNGLKTFGENITIIINTLLISIVYIIGVGPVSVAAKIKGKRFIDTSNIKKKTYWKELNLKRKSLEEYYKQF